MADEPVAVVEGPNGKAEIFEVFGDHQPLQYNLVHKGQTVTYKSLGEAYIEAGVKAGTKT